MQRYGDKAEMVIAAVAVIYLLHWGAPFFIPLLVSLLIAYALAPATDATLAMIRREHARGLLVLNRVTQRARLTAEMIAAIRRLGCVTAKAQLGNRVGFAASMGSGSTVLELEPSGKAAQEVQALTDEVLQQRWRR